MPFEEFPFSHSIHTSGRMIQGTPAGIRIDGGSHRHLEQQSRQTALERNKPLINRDPTSRAIAFEIIVIAVKELLLVTEAAQ